MLVCRRLWSAAFALIALSLGSVADAAPGSRLSFRPLSMTELYAKRMRFHQGEPMISVGIMDGQRRVELVGAGPMRLMFDEGRLPKSVFSPEGAPFRFSVKRAKPAVLRYWVLVDHTGYLAVEAAAEKQKAWEKKGYRAKVFEVGTVLALSGNVLDTRERKIAIGGFNRAADAAKLSAELYERDGLRTVTFEELMKRPSGTIEIRDGKNRLLHRASNLVYVGTLGEEMIRIGDVEHGRGYRSHGRQDRAYWGHIYVVVDRDGKLAVVNSVRAEALLGGLVPAEIFATAPMEALKAQAVTARGEIFSKLGHRHFGEPYHLCSAQHCQVYAGAGHEQPATNQAVAATRGFLAVRPKNNEKEPLVLVDSVYASTCGGFSENNEVVWDQQPSPSLRSRLDGPKNDPALRVFQGGIDSRNIKNWVESYPPTYCARSSFAKKSKVRWKKTVYADRLASYTHSLGVGRVKDVSILGRGTGGRITGLRITGSLGRADVLRELPVRRLFGNLNSGMFILDVEKGSDGFVRALKFTGGGWGHGVGMCQMGAIGRAEAGQDFRRILSHYYNGATVERIY